MLETITPRQSVQLLLHPALQQTWTDAHPGTELFGDIPADVATVIWGTDSRKDKQRLARDVLKAVRGQPGKCLLVAMCRSVFAEG